MGGLVPHAMATPGTKRKMDPIGVPTSNPGPLMKAFTNYSSTGDACIVQSKYRSQLRAYRRSGLRHPHMLCASLTQSPHATWALPTISSERPQEEQKGERQNRHHRAPYLTASTATW